ncbi:MAG: hypothetical protein ACOY3X_00970 [Pseudomonadota bacterium]
MDRFKVRRQAKKRIYVHNDLSNVAFYLRNRIEEKEASGDREGISLDVMACLAMLAFEFEAKVNFIGAKAVHGWKERQPFKNKVQAISDAIGYKLDESTRPYQTICNLKYLRDSFAHGKPAEIEIDETVDLTEEQLYETLDLNGEWEDQLTPEFVRICSEDIDSLWKEWLVLANIELFETITSGEDGITILEKYSDAGT